MNEMMKGQPKTECAFEQPLVSVIIPTYNDSATLADAIDSALHQTYPAIEVVVIDDGSEDDGKTKRIAADYRDRIVFHSMANEGVAAARNVGIELAKGTYLAFLDADDRFHPDKIERQVRYLQENALSFCHSAYNRVRFSGEQIGTVDASLNSGWNYPRIIQTCLIATPTVMIQKDQLNGLRFREDLSIGEDTCFWIDVAANMELGYLPMPLTDVRVNDDSAAYNGRKSMLGMTNIIHHVLCNEDHAKHLFEIRRLVMYLERATNDAILNDKDPKGQPNSLNQSFSWRITRPIRAVTFAFRSPGYTVRESLSRLSYYWRNKKLDLLNDYDILHSPYWKVTSVFRSIASLFHPNGRNENQR